MYRLPDQLVPNGRTFTIADINDITGGTHYVQSQMDLYSIHSSRLIDGMLCLVQEERTFYQYNAMYNTWSVYSGGGLQAVYLNIQDEIPSYDSSQFHNPGDLIYNIAENRYYQAQLTDDTPSKIQWSDLVDGFDSLYLVPDAIPDDEQIYSAIGNIPAGTTKGDLNGKSVSDILTMMLFRERPAVFTLKAEGRNSVSTKQSTYDVGVVLTPADLTTTVATASYGYVEHIDSNYKVSYTIDTEPWTVSDPYIVGGSNFTVKYGTASNVYAAKFTWTPPDVSLLTARGDQPTNSPMPVTIQSETINGKVTGTYTVYWKYGVETVDIIKKEDDIATFVIAGLEAGDEKVNADIDFSNGITTGVVNGAVNELVLGGPKSYLTTEGSTTVLRLVDETHTVTIPQKQRALEKDIVNVKFSIGYGNKSGMGSGIRLKDENGVNIVFMQHARWYKDGQNTDNLNLDFTGLYSSTYNNAPIIGRMTTFDITINYQTRTITTVMSCPVPAATQTFTAELTNINPVATFEVYGFGVGSNPDRADAFTNLRIMTTRGDYGTSTPNFTMSSAVSNKLLGNDNVSGMKSTAFVYFYLPGTLKITSGTIRNGATGQYDAIPSDWITDTGLKAYRTAEGKLSDEPSSDDRYVYSIYRVAKSATVTAGNAPTQAPIKISIS